MLAFFHNYVFHKSHSNWKQMHNIECMHSERSQTILDGFRRREAMRYSRI